MPHKAALDLTLIQFLMIVVKPIKGGFRILNVGFHYAGITIS